MSRSAPISDLSVFLADLRQRMPSPVEPAALPEEPVGDLRAVMPDEDLVARFTEAATASGWNVHSAKESDWCEAVAAILGQHDAKSVVVMPQDATAMTSDRAASLETALAASGVDTSRSLEDGELFSTDAAITGVAAAIAETGTVVCTSGPSVARGASLIPPVHVAVLTVDQIVGDLFDYFGKSGCAGTLPANLNLISGPSKTADIEGILITGVHGPETVHAVLISPRR